jgi:GNAT superfamily N-acetyltransferase
MAQARRVRTATEAELGQLGAMYERTHFHPTLGLVCRFARESLAGEVFVAALDGELLGASACVSFGATGWIGGVAVVPEARRAGLGHALTEVAVAWLRDSGAGTIHLYATEMGRPIYERLGFVAEGACVSLAGSRRASRRPPGVRPARADDLEAALTLDRRATGEDRSTLLTTLWPGSALVAETAGQVAGFHLAAPWRAGGATVAADAASGSALLGAANGRPDGAVPALSVPEGNPSAIRAMRTLGHSERSRATRMCLGPPVPWQPEVVFSTFNLFWG